MRVQVLDPEDDAAFDAWFAVLSESFGAHRPGEPGWLAVERRALLRDFAGATWTQHLAVSDDDGTMVGCAWLDMERFDNLQLAQVWPWVLPDHEGRGAGSALIGEAERLALAAGRRTMACAASRPFEMEVSPVERFARHLGYEVALRVIRSELALPPDGGALAALADRCRAFAQGYSIVTFEDHWPDELVESRLALGVTMSQDQPNGDLDFVEEHWDEPRLRKEEELLRAMDRHYLVAVARHDESGAVVAFSELGVSKEDPRRAYQFDTLVVGAHRGRRLGTLVKLANIAALIERSPHTGAISTENAEENGPMLSVNYAMGFVPQARVEAWQKRLA
jgi:GNAT superfamily N-acetyltransferase